MNKHKLRFLTHNRPAFLKYKLTDGRRRGMANNTLIIQEALRKPISPEYQGRMDFLASIKNDISDKLTLLWGTADKMDRIGKEYNEFGEDGVNLTPDYERGANRRKTDGGSKRGEKTFAAAGYRVPGIIGGGEGVNHDLKFGKEKVEREVSLE